MAEESRRQKHRSQRRRLSRRVEEDLANLDPEVLRQRAAERRKLKEAEDAAARQAAVAARKEEEERRKRSEAGSRQPRSSQGHVKRPKRLHEAPTATPAGEEQPQAARQARSQCARRARKQRGTTCPCRILMR